MQCWAATRRMGCRMALVFIDWGKMLYQSHLSDRHGQKFHYSRTRLWQMQQSKSTIAGTRRLQPHLIAREPGNEDLSRHCMEHEYL